MVFMIPAIPDGLAPAAKSALALRNAELPPTPPRSSRRIG